MKVISLLLVALIMVLAIPANTGNIATNVTVVGGNAPPTIDNVITDIGINPENRWMR